MCDSDVRRKESVGYGLFKSDVWVEGVGYTCVCVCLKYKVKAWEICVCMTDV